MTSRESTCRRRSLLFFPRLSFLVSRAAAYGSASAAAWTAVLQACDACLECERERHEPPALVAIACTIEWLTSWKQKAASEWEREKSFSRLTINDPRLILPPLFLHLICVCVAHSLIPFSLFSLPSFLHQLAINARSASSADAAHSLTHSIDANLIVENATNRHTHITSHHMHPSPLVPHRLPHTHTLAAMTRHHTTHLDCRNDR